MRNNVEALSDWVGLGEPLLRTRIRRDRCVTFVFHIVGIENIRVVYGERAAYEVTNVVKRALAKRGADFGQASCPKEGAVVLALWDVAMLGHDASDYACERFIADFVSIFALRPIPVQGALVHICLSAAYSIVGPERPLRSAAKMIEDLCRSSAAYESSACAPYGSRQWATNFRNDMRVAARLLSDVAGASISYAWQPVRSSRSTKILYYERLLRMKPEDVQTSTADAVRSLERVGLVRGLDQRVMADTIDDLMTYPAVHFGVNISAQSAQVDAWWSQEFDSLSANPDLSKRLIIEITETSDFQDISRTAEFIARMQKIGVRVALDDFGTGHTSFRRLLTLRPDIIKIDRFFLRRAAESEKGTIVLGHLIGLAKTAAPTVVLEGVETADDYQLAAENGAEWQQGFYFGRPKEARQWRIMTG